MRNLYKLIDKLIEMKYMVRFAAWPGGARSLAVYASPEQSEQYLYEGTLEEIERNVFKDFGHFLNPAPTVRSIPLPPGFKLQ